MKAIYKGKEVQIWQISKTAEQPEWIKAAFKANYLKWSGDKLLFIMNGVKAPVKLVLGRTLRLYLMELQVGGQLMQVGI